MTKVITEAAEAQGLDAGAVLRDGHEVVMPRALATRMDSSGLSGFPPRSRQYSLSEPVEWHDPANPKEPTFTSVADHS